MRQSLVEIVSKVLTITSNRDRRINVIQSMVDTTDSPPLMWRLVLWGTVWQVNQQVWHKNFLNRLQNCWKLFLWPLKRDL